MSNQEQALIVLTANARDLDRVLNGSKSKFKSFGKQIRLELKSGLGNIGGLMGLGGAAGIFQAGRQVFDFQKKLTRLGIDAELTGDQIKSFEQKIFEVAKNRGINPDDLLGAADKYQEKTSKLQDFIGSMDELAIAVGATGAGAEDLSLLQANMARLMGITDPKDVAQAFNILQQQARSGAVKLGEIATVMPALIGQFRGFKTSGLEGLSEMSVLLQILEQGFGTASEAATGFASVMTSIGKDEKKMKKFGVNARDAQGKMRDLATIMFELYEKAGGDQAKLFEVFGRGETVRAILEVGKAGRKGFNELYREGMSANTIMKDFNKYIDSTGGKMEKANARMREAFNNALAKNIEKIATALEKIADVIDWIATNPKTALAVAALAKFGPALAAAGMGMGGRGAAAAAAAGAAGGGGGAAAAGGGAAAGAGARALPLAVRAAGPIAAAGAILLDSTELGSAGPKFRGAEADTAVQAGDMKKARDEFERVLVNSDYGALRYAGVREPGGDPKKLEQLESALDRMMMGKYGVTGREQLPELTAPSPPPEPTPVADTAPAKKKGGTRAQPAQVVVGLSPDAKLLLEVMNKNDSIRRRQ